MEPHFLGFTFNGSSGGSFDSPRPYYFIHGPELPFNQCIVEKIEKILGGNTLYFSLQFSALFYCKTHHRFPAQFLRKICHEYMPLLYYGHSLIVVFYSYWWSFYCIFSFIYTLFANAKVGFLNVYKMILRV